MITVRAWPDRPPPGRARIEDAFPRVPVDDYDYRALTGLGQDVISLDWDIAVGLEELTAFAARAARDPTRPLAAPCRLYCDGDYPMPVPQWNARVYERGGRDLRYVAPGEPVCHLFGFGMVYLPAAALSAYAGTHPGKRLDDTSFSGWWYTAHGLTELDWAVRPVHLHYPVPR